MKGLSSVIRACPRIKINEAGQQAPPPLDDIWVAPGIDSSPEPTEMATSAFHSKEQYLPKVI